MLLTEHFTTPPNWTWFILLYFFFAGLSGGAYTIGTLIRLAGRPADEPLARLAFLLSFPLLVVCPILLTIDLGQPLKFWHMVFDTGAAGPGLNFKYWTPMSLGVWGLMVFGIFSFISFLEAVALDRRVRYPGGPSLAGLLEGVVGRLVNVIGTVFGLFIAAYTGVLLSVSNQPVWSDTWALGALFLASGMSGAAALLTLATRWRPAAAASLERLEEADGWFALLEAIFLVVLFVWLAFVAQLGKALALPWAILWVLAVLSLAIPLANRFGTGYTVGAGGTAAMTRGRVRVTPAVGAGVVLLGVLLLRAAVIFSAQA